jgi:hypothetical protein
MPIPRLTPPGQAKMFEITPTFVFPKRPAVAFPLPISTCETGETPIQSKDGPSCLAEPEPRKPPMPPARHSNPQGVGSPRAVRATP